MLCARGQCSVTLIAITYMYYYCIYNMQWESSPFYKDYQSLLSCDLTIMT